MQESGRNHILPTTSPIARSNASNRPADFKMVFHVKLLTTLRTLFQLLRCFRKKVLLTLYSGTDCSTRSTQLTKKWSEVRSRVPTYTMTMSRASIIKRSSLLPAMWVEQLTNCSQPDIIQKSKASRLCRSVCDTGSNHSEWWAFVSPAQTTTALNKII